MKDNIKVGIFHTEEMQNKINALKALEIAQKQNKPVKYLTKRFVL